MRANGLPDDVPEQFCRAMSKFTFTEAVPVASATFDKPMLVSSSLPPEVAEATWNAIRAKAQADSDIPGRSESHSKN